jgi:hypothetical protein
VLRRRRGQLDRPVAQVAFYVRRDEFEDVTALTLNVSGCRGLRRGGDLCCFCVGDDLAACVDEAEPGRAAGARELLAAAAALGT